MKKIQSEYSYDDLIISGEESLFGPGNAKLPSSANANALIGLLILV